MASPARKKAASPTNDAAGELTDAGAAKAIVDIFHGLIGDDASLKAMHEEYVRMANNEKIRLERQADLIMRRRLERQQRYDAKRRADEERRLHEKRNNPENLAACAAQIQKYVKAIPQRRKYETLRLASNERAKKLAIVIIIDGFDDNRVREPSMVAQDGYDLVRVLQHTGFAVDVYSTKAQSARFKPTKANIMKAIDDAIRTTPQDAMLWVHICGVGGVSTVSGRNPLKAALQELSTKQTPRTRMLRALQANHRAPGTAGAVAGGGDICRYVFPSDARSGRLTYDSIISVDEVLALLDPRNLPMSHGRSLTQRLVTIDVCALGQTEGHQGGGYCLLASTVGPKLMIEMHAGDAGGPAGKGMELQEPHRGLLSAVVLRSLLGEGWIPARTFDPSQLYLLRKLPPKEVETDSPSKDAEEEASSRRRVLVNDVVMGCTVESITEALKKRADLLGLRVDVSGKTPWGDIPLLSGDAGASCIAALEAMYAVNVDPQFGVAAVPAASLAPSASGTSFAMSKAQAAQARATRRKVPAAVRACSFEVDYLINMSSSETSYVNTFDADYLGTLFHWTHVMCQPDPAAPPHRQLKIMPTKSAIRRTLLIGIAGNFVDVATRVRVSRGGEGIIWQQVVDRLTTKMIPAAKSGAGKGVTLPPITATPSSSKYLVSGGAQDSNADSPTASAMAVTPVFTSSIGAASPASLAGDDADGEHRFSVYLGRTEEGGITLAIPVRSADEVDTIMKQLHVIPEYLEGIKHQSVRLELTMEVTGCPANIHTLRNHGRGWYSPIKTEHDDEALLILAKSKSRGSNSGGGRNVGFNAGAAHHSMNAADVNLDDLVSTSDLGAAHMEERTLAILLERACTGTVRRPQAHMPTILAPNHVCVSRVVARVQRVNDLDDAAYEALRSRERPATITMPMPSQTGVAICCVAMMGATPEQRSRQAIELAKVAPIYECYAGLRFMLWDAAEVLWALPVAPVVTNASSATLPALGATVSGSSFANPPNHASPDPSHAKRDKIGKLLESVKGMIPSVNFPALLVLDLYKKRYYRTRLPSGGNFFLSEQIAHFCDDYCRGALSDLLPPVKGCRVYGGSVASAKYTLIPV